jgi:hypothetical protein
VEGPPVLQTVHLTEIVTVWDKSIELCKKRLLESPFISKGTPKTAAVFLKLSEPLPHKVSILWLDNYYTSPAVAVFLSCNTNCVGVVRKKLQKGRVIMLHDCRVY